MNATIKLQLAEMNIEMLIQTVVSHQKNYEALKAKHDELTALYTQTKQELETLRGIAVKLEEPSVGYAKGYDIPTKEEPRVGLVSDDDIPVFLKRENEKVDLTTLRECSDAKLNKDLLKLVEADSGKEGWSFIRLNGKRSYFQVDGDNVLIYNGTANGGFEHTTVSVIEAASLGYPVAADYKPAVNTKSNLLKAFKGF